MEKKNINNEIAWDRFSGLLNNYIIDYLCANSQSKLFENAPKVNYEIKNADKLETDWALSLSSALKINDLPPELKKVAVQFLPEFLKKFPQYENSECLIYETT